MKKLRFSVFVSVFLLVLAVSAGASGFEKSRTYSSNFNDIQEGKWFTQSVKDVYELALMEGVTSDTFDADSQMSVAQSITIAARLHSIYNNTEIPEFSGNTWYMKYVNYCKENGIIDENQFNSYGRPVMAFEMVQLFASALPEEYFPKINDITYIQDVREDMSFADDVFMFYRAGVLNGNDSYGTFLPMSEITRKRAAVLLARTVLPEQRLKYSLETKRETYTLDEVFAIVDKETVRDTLDDVELISADSYSVSAAEYRYYSGISNGDAAKIEGLVKSSAAKMNIIRQVVPQVSFDVLCDILSTYYDARTDNYGTSSYFDALDAQRLSDSFYAKLVAINELYYLAVKASAESVSQDDVYDYALENDFVCEREIFIAKSTPDAYKIILQAYLDLANGADFEELLVEIGQDPSMKTRQSGYYFTKGWKAKEIENAVYGLKEGEISEIVTTPLGYHIIKRLPIKKNELLASPDYTLIAANTATEQFNEKLIEAQNSVNLTYVENFEGLSAILR